MGDVKWEYYMMRDEPGALREAENLPPICGLLARLALLSLCLISISSTSLAHPFQQWGDAIPKFHPLRKNGMTKGNEADVTAGRNSFEKTYQQYTQNQFTHKIHTNLSLSTTNPDLIPSDKSLEYARTAGTPKNVGEIRRGKEYAGQSLLDEDINGHNIYEGHTSERPINEGGGYYSSQIGAGALCGKIYGDVLCVNRSGKIVSNDNESNKTESYGLELYEGKTKRYKSWLKLHMRKLYMGNKDCFGRCSTGKGVGLTKRDSGVIFETNFLDIFSGSFFGMLDIFLGGDFLNDIFLEGEFSALAKKRGSFIVFLFFLVGVFLGWGSCGICLALQFAWKTFQSVKNGFTSFMSGVACRKDTVEKAPKPSGSARLNVSVNKKNGIYNFSEHYGPGNPYHAASSKRPSENKWRNGHHLEGEDFVQFENDMSLEEWSDSETSSRLTTVTTNSGGEFAPYEFSASKRNTAFSRKSSPFGRKACDFPLHARRPSAGLRDSQRKGNKFVIKLVELKVLYLCMVSELREGLELISKRGGDGSKLCSSSSSSKVDKSAFVWVFSKLPFSRYFFLRKFGIFSKIWDLLLASLGFLRVENCEKDGGEYCGGSCGGLKDVSNFGKNGTFGKKDKKFVGKYGAVFRPVLHEKIRKGDLAGVARVVNLEDVNLQDHSSSRGESPLYLAVKGGHMSLVELLVKHGAEVDRKNKDGEMPIYAAAEEGNIFICRYLLDLDALESEITMYVALLKAVCREKWPVIAELLKFALAILHKYPHITQTQIPSIQRAIAQQNIQPLKNHLKPIYSLVWPFLNSHEQTTLLNS